MTTFPGELLDEQTRGLREEVRAFVKAVPRELLLDMDAERVRYPKDFLVDAGRQRLLGLRFPEPTGDARCPGPPRWWPWRRSGSWARRLACLYSLCPSSARHCILFGTAEQRSATWRPRWRGGCTCAEALTEPRGGSDFFGAA